MSQQHQPPHDVRLPNGDGCGQGRPDGEPAGVEAVRTGALLRIAEAMESLVDRIDHIGTMVTAIAIAVSDSRPRPDAEAAKRDLFIAERAKLSTRAKGVLWRMKIDSFDQLAATTREDLRCQENCGEATVKEIAGLLDRFGLTFRRRGNS